MMARPWWVVSRVHGGLEKVTSAPSLTDAKRLSERELESVVALNPWLIGVERDLPLLYHGGQCQPDQLYIGDGGRLTVVEFKSRRATPDDLVQLVAYGYHWPSLDISRFGRMFNDLAAQAVLLTGVHVLTTASPPAADLLEVSKESAFLARVRKLGGRRVEKLGHAALRRSDGDTLGWAGARSGLYAKATELWGERALGLGATTPRLVLVAPDFDDECIALAEKLACRWVQVEITRIAGFRARISGRVATVLQHARVRQLPQMTELWSAVCDISRLPEIGARYAAGPWYMHLRDPLTAVISLFHRSEKPGVGIQLTASVDESRKRAYAATAHLTYPDGWFEVDGSAKRRMLKQIEGRVPGFDREEKYWGFDLPRGRSKWIATARRLAVEVDVAFGNPQ